MCPLQIEILLHTYSHGDGYRGESFGSPAYHDFMGEFLETGLIGRGDADKFALTDKGMDVVRRLMEVQP